MTIENIQYYNISQEEAQSKKRNFFIGVSVGTKPHTLEDRMDYYSLAHVWTKRDEGPLVLICDVPAAINYEVLEGASAARSRERAREVGEEEKDLFVQAGVDESNIVFWDDVVKQNPIEYEVGYLRRLGQKNVSFARDVERLIIGYLQNRGMNPYSDRLIAMSDYITTELPFILHGFEYDDVRYDAQIYPSYNTTSIAQFSTDIQNGKRHNNIKKSLQLGGDFGIVDFTLKNPKPRDF